MNDTPVPRMVEVYDTAGQVVGSISAEELARLRKENEVLQRHVRSLLPKATPEQEAEMAEMLSRAVPLDIEGLLNEIESDRSH